MDNQDEVEGDDEEGSDDSFEDEVDDKFFHDALDQAPP
jgi:hypothetical protein